MTSRNSTYLLCCGALLVTMLYAESLRINAVETVKWDMPALLDQAHALPQLESRAPRHSEYLERSQPLEFLRQARGAYAARVRDYRCTFTKQEQINQSLGLVQTSSVKFREGPFSVFMHVHGNPGKARRILYVQDRHVEDGEQLAVIEPENPLARLLVRSVKRAIHGRDAKSASRRAISEFGFGRSLDLIIKYADKAIANGQGSVSYVGDGAFDGRPTHVIHRVLPYQSDRSYWPDALLVVHIDQEWHVPVACYAYADAAGTQLLGSYEYTDVELNVGLTDDDFSPERYGL